MDIGGYIRKINEKDNKNRKNYRKFLWFTVCPFLIPFINEIPNEMINQYIKWTVILFLITIDFYFSIKMLKEEGKEEKEHYVQKAVRYAYSNAHELMQSKRDMLSHDLEFNKIDL